jgi:hypothetical protein
MKYTFDTTRAITNMLFTGTRKEVPDMKIIFCHGGCTISYLSTRIAGQSTLPFQGSHDFGGSMDELKEYCFDLAAATAQAQLPALTSWCGSSQLLVGSDCKYILCISYSSTLTISYISLFSGKRMIPTAQATLANYSGLTLKDQLAIKHGNSLCIFPTNLEKLSKQKK